MRLLSEMADRARAAARRLAVLDRGRKDAVLANIATRLVQQAEPGSPLLVANAIDVEGARASGVEEAMVDRLRLDPARVSDIAKGVRAIAALEDPVGAIRGATTLSNGLRVSRRRIPLGVIAIIYEARPNVTVDAAALCLKSGNAVMLRGGREAAASNAALTELVRAALVEASAPEDAVVFVPPGDREEIRALVSLSGKIDLAIPRGGEALIRFVTENARVPVIQHYKGVCHVYVDDSADLEMARAIVENAKLSRVSVCNALECLLVHRAVAKEFLPRLAGLVEAGRLEVRADAAALALVPGAKLAAPSDFGQEFLAPVLAVAVVDDLDAALDHIARYGSNHTEAIVTRTAAHAERFQREVDASCVVVNASTRFNDGGSLGLGAEMGISTSKLHAYGPMGLVELTSEKWIVVGEGQIR